MKTVTINLPKELEEKIELLLEKEFFPNKSELIRTAIKFHKYKKIKVSI